MIECSHISKHFKVAKREKGVLSSMKSFIHPNYKTIEALHDLSFSIEEGEIIGYIGPNGAGKSTTIKIMSGILVPSDGVCQVMGYTPWKNRKEYVKNIGVVFGQRSQLWWDVPVIDSLQLLKDIYKVPDSIYKANLELLTDTLDLNSLLQTPVRQLSLGQRMRCELGASLIHDPKILFLDEPTIGLDAVSKLAVRRFIKTINQEKKVTIILTTHDMFDIEALAERIILIGKGTKLYDGNIQALKNRFGNQKTILVDYTNGPTSFQTDATILANKPGHLTLSIDTEKQKVSTIINQLSNNFEITDITVQNRPIEEIIVEMYKEYQI